MEVTIRDESLSGRETGSIGLEIPESITLRELIRLRVREEVARFNARPTDRFSGLVRPAGSTEEPGGYRMPDPAGPIDWERQADAALTAFLRNGFVVLVGDRQVEDLDEPLRLDVASDVTFVRLVPLVGG
jgi:hypothetical protein